MLKVRNVAVAMLCLTTLVVGGCGKKAPTVDTLISSPFNGVDVTSADVNFSLSMDALPEGSAETDKVTSSLSFNVKYTPEVYYMEGTSTAKGSDMDASVPVKVYSVVDATGKSVDYTWDTEGGRWVYGVVQAGQSYAVRDMLKLSQNMFMSYEYTDSDSTDYAVHAQTKGSSIFETLGIGSMHNLLISDVSDASDMSLDTVLTFGSDSKQLKSALFKADNPVTAGGVTYSNFEMTITINGINGVELTLPDEVKNNAVQTEGNSNVTSGNGVGLGDASSAFSDLKEEEETEETDAPETDDEDTDEEEEEAPQEDFGNPAFKAYEENDYTQEVVDPEVRNNPVSVHTDTPAEGGVSFYSALFGDASYTVEDLRYMIAQEYGFDPGDEVMYTMESWIHDTPENWIETMGTDVWQYLTDKDKVSIALMYKFGCLGDAFAAEAGLPVDEMKALVEAQ